MFSRNLKYYRLKNQMTRAEIARRAGLSERAIAHYESGDQYPELPVIRALADALGVRRTDFLRRWNENPEFTPAEYRRDSRLSRMQQEYLEEMVEEYFGRFYDVLEILGGEVLPGVPETKVLPLSEDAQEDAGQLRRSLQIAAGEPVGRVIDLLESRGFLVLRLDVDFAGFLGMSGTVNGRPYIAVNRSMTAEETRMALVCELAHLAFRWPSDLPDREVERRVTAIAGAFLSPGEGRTKSAGSAEEAEETTLSARLVYRAVCAGDITIQKGAELLRVPYDEAARNCAAREQDMRFISDADAAGGEAAFL